MVEASADKQELQRLPDFSPSLPPFDLPLWDSASPVLGKAQSQHSKEDVEGVG